MYGENRYKKDAKLQRIGKKRKEKKMECTKKKWILQIWLNGVHFVCLWENKKPKAFEWIYGTR